MGTEFTSPQGPDMEPHGLLVVTSLLAGLVLLTSPVLACNEAVCASIVSKCMLLQSCKCELQPDCTCCKRCFECLDYLYSECCSCVDMCPKPNVTIHELSKKSHVEDIEENSPTLFQALTDLDLAPFLPANKNPALGSSLEEGKVTVNCSVAYMAQCMSWNKCKASCRSMGAT